ncbi:amidase [Nitratireductor aquibiodomus]|uniref:amidase n=1 Tax=Nitratireductor aquibiodomus TaxID=204799 RepID=UPI000A744E09|nr:amidase [Nitratireductor aquibiodomus]
MHDELWSWNASDLAKAIRERRVSSREAVESAVARMEAVNPHLNAVVDPLPEAALSEARAADNALARGDAPGILHGVPVTVKINVDYAGRATTNGVRSQADLIAPEDGSVVRNLRAAGAIVIGRTNTPCYSMRWFTDNALHGATLNPHDKDITPGGSSGGAGSAAAAGIGTIAHGNDIGGSIRYPAYCCGVYGLRPSSGLLPSYNPSQLSERMIASQMMAVQGPLARSASDLSLGIEALSRHDPRDVWQVPAPNLTSPEMQKPCRVALFTDPEECAVDPEVAQAILLAAERLREAGYQVEEVPIPSISEAAHLWRMVMINEMRSGLLTQIEKNGDAAIRYAAEAFCEGVPELDRTGFLQALASEARFCATGSCFLKRIHSCSRLSAGASRIVWARTRRTRPGSTVSLQNSRRPRCHRSLVCRDFPSRSPSMVRGLSAFSLLPTASMTGAFLRPPTPWNGLAVRSRQLSRCIEAMACFPWLVRWNPS